MKKAIYLTVILPLILYGCESFPKALFSADPGDPVVGEEVWFTNESDNATSFEWDFGDGMISNEVHPIHAFTASGSYEVKLKAWNEHGVNDEASMILDVQIPTLLEIEVLEYFDEYPVSNASVILYPSLDDWDNETDMVNEGYTDNEGKVVFANLPRYSYFVDVWEATHDNYSLRNDDVGFIQTPEIIPHKINRFIAYVDYVEHGKGVARRGSTMIIKKLERKAADKPQPVPYYEAGDWKTLYDKRVNNK
jgi:PKD repeat protein